MKTITFLFMMLFSVTTIVATDIGITKSTPILLHEKGVSMLSTDRGSTWNRYNYHITKKEANGKSYYSFNRGATWYESTEANKCSNTAIYSANSLSIKINEAFAITTADISIYDLTGNNIYKKANQSFENNTFQALQLAKGVYFIQVTINENITTYKMMVD